MPVELFDTVLEKIFVLTPTVQTFRFRYKDGRGFAFKPGQFAMVHIPGPDKPDTGKVLKKPYSINSSPFEVGFIDLCVKFVEGGFATNWFWERKEGEEFKIGGPYGNFLMKEPIDYDPIFIATGTGLAPLRSMIRQGYHDHQFPSDKKVTLIFGVRYENEIFYADEFRALEKEHPNFQFIPTISRPKDWQGEVGYVQDKLKQHITNATGKMIYVCGLSPMIKAVEETALAIGFDKKQIHYEKYA